MVEMLVVMAIIGILISLVLYVRQSSREKSKMAQAKQDVAEIGTAVARLFEDTRKYPHCFTSVNIGDDTEIPISSSAAGLTSSPDACFTNWQGPYYSGSTIDPWGREYQIDYDYFGPPYEDIQSVIKSFGSDGVDYSCDDIYKSLYSREPKTTQPPSWNGMSESGYLDSFKADNDSCQAENRLD